MLTLRRPEHLFRYLVGCKLDKGLIQKEFSPDLFPNYSTPEGGFVPPFVPPPVPEQLWCQSFLCRRNTHLLGWYLQH